MTDPEFGPAWHQIKGKLNERWGKLTEDDCKQLEEQVEQLVEKLRHQYARAEAGRQAKETRKQRDWS